MTNRIWFKNVLDFIPSSPIPAVFRFTQEAEDQFRNHRCGHFDPVTDTYTSAVFSQTNSGWEEVKPGFFKDYFGVIWNKTKDKTLGVVHAHPIQKPSLRDFHFPDTSWLPVYDYIKENNLKYPDHFNFLSIGFALYERAWSLVGIENLMIWMLSEPGFVHDLLDQITDYNISLIHHAVDMGGIDGVRLGDDWAGQQGLLFGEELWLEFVKPRMMRICEAAKKKNLYIGQHCCGKVDELLPHLVELGIHVFDPFQPEVTDIFSIYRKYYGKIVFMGGLSIQKTMPFGTEEEVWSECVHLLNILGKNGGYVFSPSHALTPDIPVNNIETMIRAFREYSNKSFHG